MASLVAEGIWTGTTAADDQDDTPSAPTPDLTAELAAMRHRAELAEQDVARLEQTVDLMTTAMRMLEAGPQRRRRWFRSAD